MIYTAVGDSIHAAYELWRSMVEEAQRRRLERYK